MRTPLLTLLLALPACSGTRLGRDLDAALGQAPEVHAEGVLWAALYQGLRWAEGHDEPGHGGIPRPGVPVVSWGSWQLTAGLSVHPRAGQGDGGQGDGGQGGVKFRFRRRGGGAYLEVVFRW